MQEEDRLSLVMECMEGGELFDRVREKKVYSEKAGIDRIQASYKCYMNI